MKLGMGNFWETKSLDAMSDSEWESLCDGCGRCCLQKLEDEDTREIRFTRVACRLLDSETCGCSDYTNRMEKVVDCLSIKPLTEQKLGWLPDSCAYKKLSAGQPLEDWHPLISGNTDSVKQAGISMAGQIISEEFVMISEYINQVVELDETHGE